MSKKKRIRIDQILLQTLKLRGDTPFSTTKIRDLYVTQMTRSRDLDRNSIRKHIYKEVLRLESAFVIKRHKGEKGRGCRFIYEGAPEGVLLEAKPSPFEPSEGTAAPPMEPAILEGLMEELSTRKVELIASIGEAEEYQRLCKKFPSLQQTVRTQYLESRERSTKLLGQLRAVETILADIGSHR
ncbi:hypothetical protein J3362_13215 [Marinobacter sp. NFXS11]|uniref:hypothetical protein n=1 Tax=Marinobacter sp. NFXS11 TaxID=2818432 RepID=UPI000C93B4E7|nr:hypothetical protein [Rhodopirellula sp.]